MTGTPPVADAIIGADRRASSYAKAGLILATLTLFVSAHLVHYAMGLMALLGVLDAVRHPDRLREWHARQLLLLFALLWLPMLIASLGAVAPSHTLHTVLPYLHLLPAAYFMMRACADVEVQRLVTLGAAMLVAFVALDAFVQLIWHRDLYGYPYDRHVLTGVFYPKQRLGLFLAVFAPLYVDVVIRWCRLHPRLWLLLVPLLVVILMSLKRSAWIMLAAGLLAYVLLYLRLRQRPWNGRRVAQFALLLILAGGLAVMNPTLRARLHDTSGLFSTNAQAIDEATAYRLTLWRTGARIFADHRLTGIGPRGFRHILCRVRGTRRFLDQAHRRWPDPSPSVHARNRDRDRSDRRGRLHRFLWAAAAFADAPDARTGGAGVATGRSGGLAAVECPSGLLWCLLVDARVVAVGSRPGRSAAAAKG